MKVKEIEANIKIQDELGNVVSVVTAKGTYSEPESVEEFLKMNLDEDTKLRVIQYGLNTIRGGELRASNNYSPVVKKMVEMGIFKTHREAFEHLIALKNAKAA